MCRTSVARIDFYFEDWLTGTFELTPEQRGVYITLCALICKTGDRLRDDDVTLARWNGMKVRRWRTVRGELVAAGKITIDDGFVRNSRVAAELATAENRRKMAQEKGQKGGQKRIKTESIQNPNPLINNEPAPSPAQATYTYTNSTKEESKGLPIPASESPTLKTESYLAPSGASGASAFRWRGECIRLHARHYDGWQRAYHAVDLDSNLQALDDFLVGLPPDDRRRKDWFQMVSGALRKRHEAALLRQSAPPPPPPPKREVDIRRENYWKHLNSTVPM